MLKNKEEGLQNYITIVTPQGKGVEVRIEEAIKILSIVGNTQIILENKYLSCKIEEDTIKKIEKDIWYLIANYYIGIELPPIIPKATIIDHTSTKTSIKQSIELEFGIIPDRRSDSIKAILDYIYDSLTNLKNRNDVTFEYLISRLVDYDSELVFDKILGQMVVKTSIEDFDKMNWKTYCKMNLEQKANNRLKVPRNILKYNEKKKYINKMKEDFKEIDNKDKQFKKFNKEEFEKIKENSIGDVNNHINEKKINPQISLF